MLNKMWFQLGVGILLLILIIKNVVEIQWLFEPIFIVITSILIPVLLAGLLFYITEPLHRFLMKKNSSMGFSIEHFDSCRHIGYDWRNVYFRPVN